MINPKKHWHKPLTTRLKVITNIALGMFVATVFLVSVLREVLNNPNLITIGLGLPFCLVGLMVAYFKIADEAKETFTYYQFTTDSLVKKIPFFTEHINYQVIQEIIERKYSPKYAVLEIEYAENNLLEINSKLIDYEEFKINLITNCGLKIVEVIEY